MTPDRIREIFLALKLHYTGKYDYTKFASRKLRGAGKADLIHYEKLADKLTSDNSVELFFVSAFLMNFQKNMSVPTFIGDYNKKEYFENLKVWYRSITANLKDNFNSCMEQYESMEELVAIGRSVPKIFEEYMSGKVSLDILAIFVYKNKDNPEIAMWDVIADSDPLFEKLYFIVKKHILFLKYKGVLQ